jgi:TPR repeat protein
VYKLENNPPEEAQGVPQDYAKALEWYQKAAKQGHPEAQKQLDD